MRSSLRAKLGSVLLDECVPRPLLRDLTGHDGHHVVDLGWSSKRNGELLKLMVAEHFEALFTVDRNLPFQQDVRTSGIAVVIAMARTNRVKELRPLMPKVLDALRKSGRSCSGPLGREGIAGWWELRGDFRLFRVDRIVTVE